MAQEIVDRLKSLKSLAGMPVEELKWLSAHGKFEKYDVGTVISPKGKPVKYLWIIFSGKIAIRVDRGVGPRLVAEWGTGEVTGMLPYSRMSGPPGDNYVEEEGEALSIHVDLFPEMINKCPSFTAFTVHTMLDRVRNFNTSDLQDEKMISLGKLSAGLAHELNNPASATVRNAKLLQDGLADLENASRCLGTTRLTEEQFKNIKNLCAQCLVKSDKLSISPIQKADQQEKISEWLVHKHLDQSLAVHLSENAITTVELDTLCSMVPKETLGLILNWIVANFNTYSLAMEIEHAATQVYKVVDAVKKFTYMDNVTKREFIEIEPGIRETINVLVAKIKSKNADVSFQLADNLPRIYANGSDLNQVWFNLIDNALDAIAPTGTIRIDACADLDRAVVRIIDDGPGISQKMLSKIFDPFYTTKPPGHGTGLGLDITRRLLRRYHGDITVQSQPGETEFRVSLLVENQKSI
jgi:signal transduction histidine kinase